MVHHLQNVLACPVCRAPLAQRTDDDGGGLGCAEGHRFDAARQGYINLLSGHGTNFTPDTPEMVKARADFLARGHYEPLTAFVARTAEDHLAARVHLPVVLDAGAGTGSYLQAVVSAVPTARAVALDISKHALKKAARLLPDASCLVWDVWRPLPLQDRTVDVILNVFAPRNPAEFYRVLAPEGLLIVVTPLPNHLQEIAEAASLLRMSEGKQDDVEAGLRDRFRLDAAHAVEFRMDLTADDIADVAAMGPAGHHRGRPDPKLLPQNRTVTAAFSVQLFVPLSS